WGRAMTSCHFVHLILLSSGPKVPKSGPFKNEGIHEFPTRKMRQSVAAERPGGGNRLAFACFGESQRFWFGVYGSVASGEDVCNCLRPVCYNSALEGNYAR